jgi:hypothetical protein
MPFLATSLYGVRGNEWVDVIAAPALPLRLQGSSGVAAGTAAGTGTGSGSGSDSDGSDYTDHYYADGTTTTTAGGAGSGSDSSSSERAALAAEQERRLIVRGDRWWRSDSSSSSSSSSGTDDSDAEQYDDELYVLQEGGAQAQHRALLPHRQLGYLNGQLYMSGSMLPRRGGQLLLPGTQVLHCSAYYKADARCKPQLPVCAAALCEVLRREPAV